MGTERRAGPRIETHEGVVDKGVKILIADDCPTTRRVIVTFLRALGFVDIREADDGRTALPLLKLESFDLLIADAYMPGMSGIELLKAVRSDPELAALPVLMVTIESRPKFIADAARAGVNGYIVKPFSAQTLEHRINQIFERLAATA
jgi:two-component system chemotaxis response regulator CheY